jgi:hypothetical protein
MSSELSTLLHTLAPLLLTEKQPSHEELLIAKRLHKNRQNAILEDTRPIMTHTYNENKDEDVFFYVFGVQCEIDFFGCRHIDSKQIIKTMKTGITWEEARYLIEKKHHLFDVKQKKANLQGSYIQGFFWKHNMKNWRREAIIIQRDHILKNTDCLIIVRKPMASNMIHYIPNAHKAEVEKEERLLMTEEERQREERINKFFEQMKTELKLTDDMSEEEKINLIIKNTEDRDSIELLRTRMLGKNKRQKISSEFHPSDIEADPSIVKPPPPGYLCHRCMNRGHWKHLCPTLIDIHFIPQTVRKLPSGIPKTMLREAKTDEDRRQAMVTDDGQLVVMKHNNEYIF